MKRRLGRFRASFRRAGSTLAEIFRALWMLIEHRRAGQPQYRFTVRDAVLFGLERSWRPQSAEVDRGATPGLSVVTVGATAVHWPTHLAVDGLSWMYEEVNAPFWRNPSSYSHPETIRGRVDWVVDGGSCEGYFAEFARRSLSVPHIYLVEARADIAAALRTTFAPQIDSGEMEIWEVALGAAAGPVRLMAADGLPWETRVAEAAVDLAVRGGDLEALSEVRAETLDALLRDRCVRGTGLIKLDVEGAEEAVLAGAVETMRSLKPRLSVAVYHGRDNAERCKAKILEANPTYRVRFRGMYGWASPLRPYMLFAW